MTVGNDDVTRTILKGNVSVGTDANPIKIYGSGTGNSEVTSNDAVFNVGNTNAVGNLNLISGNQVAMTIDGDPTTGKVKILSPQGLQIQNPQTTDAPSNVPNCYIGSAGDIVKQTNPTVYSIEQVDKMLAIKDKLIEKLSARLDAIEKKVK